MPFICIITGRIFPDPIKKTQRESFSPLCARSAGCEKTRPSVFVSLRRDESLRWGSDISSQRSPLFIRRYYRNLSDYTDSAHAVCLSYFDCCCKASNQTVRNAPSLKGAGARGLRGIFLPRRCQPWCKSNPSVARKGGRG